MPPWLLVLPLAGADTNTTAVQRDSWIGVDKVKHAVVSFALQSGGYAALRAVSDHTGAVIGATVITFGVGLTKERRDRASTGFSVRDLAWDVVGIAAATIVLSHRPR